MINVLLATYNSSEYLREQLDSLFAQTIQDWRLYVRDDCSTDNTLAIIKEYQEKYPQRIVIIDNHNVSLRAYMNFVALLQAADADYYMFCDHDDVWLPQKIEVSLTRMHEIEERTPDLPIIVHTDMKVVDRNLNVIHDSFWAYSRLLPHKSSFKEMVLCNSANGCTMLFNHKAREVALPNVPYATMHDMLLNQSVAANGGIISAIHKPTVLYRQHIDNVVGARNRDLNYQLRKLKDVTKVIRQNYNDWKLSSHIKKYSFASYMWTKLKVMWWKIQMYS